METLTHPSKPLAAGERVLAVQLEIGEATTGKARVDALEQARVAARYILKQQPSHALARRAEQIAVIDMWISGAPTDAAKIDAAVAKLTELQAIDASAEIPYAIARAHGNKGFLVKTKDSAAAAAHFDRAIKTMDDALNASPRNAELMLHEAAIILAIGARLDPNSPAAELRAGEQAVAGEGRAILTEARGAAAKDSAVYEKICRMEARMASRLGDHRGVETILTELLSNQPDSLAGRLQLVDCIRLDPARTEEAFTMIENIPESTLPGMAGMLARDMRISALRMAADLRLDYYFELKEKNRNRAHQSLLRANDFLERIAAAQGDSPEYLRVRGKREVFIGDAAAAVATLKQADAKSERGSRTYFEIRYLLARAYQIQNKLDLAEPLHREVADLLDYLPAQIALSQILLARGKLDEAAARIEKLKARAPVSTEVAALVSKLQELRQAK